MTQQAIAKHRIRNWAQYNKALVQRGSLTIWFSDEAMEKWIAKKQGKKGRPQVYSDEAILCALMIKAVYCLPFRALQGLMLSIVTMLGVALPIPCYTRICRRAKVLGQQIKKLSHKKPTDIVFDSTGLKVYGEGEWKVRKHGASKRRTWRKIHLAICPDSHDIVVGCLTGNDVADCEVMPQMAKALPKSVKRGCGDGAYDTGGCHRIFHELGITPVIPPQRNGVVHDEGEEPWMMPRNEALNVIECLGGGEDGRKLWKKLVGYHKRSLAETMMFRFKQLFGGALACREEAYQKAELFAKCLVINVMNKIGMPKREWESS